MVLARIHKAYPTIFIYVGEGPFKSVTSKFLSRGCRTFVF
jgi:hypothetical protein